MNNYKDKWKEYNFFLLWNFVWTSLLVNIKVPTTSCWELERLLFWFFQYVRETMHPADRYVLYKIKLVSEISALMITNFGKKQKQFLPCIFTLIPLANCLSLCYRENSWEIMFLNIKFPLKICSNLILILNFCTRSSC